MIASEVAFLASKINESNGKPFLLRDFLPSCVTNVVHYSVTGRHYDFDHPARKAVDGIFAFFNPIAFPLTGYFCNFIKYVLLIGKLFGASKEMKKRSEAYQSYVTQMIDEHIYKSDATVKHQNIVDMYLEECDTSKDRVSITRKSEACDMLYSNYLMIIFPRF